jgi:aryl-alcohol dehydrogenase-like predicted oxidoreductase
MKQRRLGSAGLVVSDLCLGAMNFGNPRIGVGEAESRRVIDAYLDRGGNFVDTADAYSGGVSEEVVGRALAGRRDAVILATKAHFPVTAAFGDPPAHANAFGSSRRHLTQALDASLRRLGTEWIDLYQVHCWDALTPIEETLSTLDGFVRQGKVRHVGLSNFTAWQVAEAHHVALGNGWEPFVTAQVQHSLVARDVEQDVLPACERYGIGILPWSPLGQGVLTGKYRGGASRQGTRFAGEPEGEAQRVWRSRYLNERNERIADAVAEVAGRLEATPTAVSLAWLLTHGAVSSVIIGPKTVAQLEENLAAGDVDLTDEALVRLEEVSAPPPRYPEWFVASSPRTRLADALGEEA